MFPYVFFMMHRFPQKKMLQFYEVLFDHDGQSANTELIHWSFVGLVSGTCADSGGYESKSFSY